MGISWRLKITPIDIANYVASIEAVRTDSENPDNPMVYIIPRARIETTPEQIIALDRIWAKHQLALSESAAVAAFVEAKEAAGKANLEARE